MLADILFLCVHVYILSLSFRGGYLTSFPFSEVLVLKNYSSEQRQQLQAFARSLEQGGSLLSTPREQAVRYDDRRSDFSRDSCYVTADFERYERFFPRKTVGRSTRHAKTPSVIGRNPWFVSEFS